jgi:hypothetical protein
MKNLLIIIVVIVAITGGAYFIGRSSSNSTQSINTPQIPIQTPVQTNQTQPSVAQTKNTDVNLKSKCANDGQTFYTNFQKEIGKPELVWWDPQFHFDAVLNTCLMYIQWNDASIPVVYTNGLDYIQTIMNNNVVFDIYSNQAILQNEITRKSVNTNGEVQTTSVLNSSPLYQNIPNSDVDTFIAKRKVLMSE